MVGWMENVNRNYGTVQSHAREQKFRNKVFTKNGGFFVDGKN
jgi:hypothetical protein